MEKRLAKKYYDKLFKEYCIADLSRYKENKFGFRWRVEKEVISGKGQFCCGNKCCDEKEGLKSWEVNFGYTEHGEKRNALVKLRLCQECSFKLNFHHRRKEVKSKKRKDKAKKDSEESTHKKSRLSSVEETSKTKDKAHSSSVKSESSVNKYIMRNAGLEEAQVGIKIAGRNIYNLRYADDTTLMAESEEELKSLLMKVKEESEKVGLKLSIQKTRIMASGPITSWEIDGETVETVSDFILGGSKITADGDCSPEIKRRLLLGRKVMTNPDSILKSRDITLPTKVLLIKAMVFPVVMYGCESWTVKKAECQRIDAFELWCWRRLLSVPWTARRSNQSILRRSVLGVHWKD
ncbi:uncharacterized protein LOC101105041 isoform X3 [Ovis aries]|uniref:uncharacterized protein LOC101105041 isoform X3 n=1 Tax=Ovis aries TaxID=9940 RepID=UPI0029528982|nr:uncharacterized protein LOC101105041 isoform X3 [Ovis aries]